MVKNVPKTTFGTKQIGLNVEVVILSSWNLEEILKIGLKYNAYVCYNEEVLMFKWLLGEVLLYSDELISF